MAALYDGSEVTLNLTPWTTPAADSGALVNRINVLAFGGTMSRRRFIRTCGSLAAAGAGVQMLRLGQMWAMAQSSPNYALASNVLLPRTKANLNSATLPRNLYSHSDQTSQWQTANPTISGGSGWGGRMADLLAGANASTFPMGVSVNESSALLQGTNARPIKLTPGTALGLNRFRNSEGMTGREAGVQQLLTFATGMQMIGAASGIMTSAVRARRRSTRP